MTAFFASDVGTAAMLFFLITGFVFLAVMTTAIFQWLWNITMPEAFGTRPIRYWVAFRILIIAMMLASGGFLRINLNW